MWNYLKTMFGRSTASLTTGANTATLEPLMLIPKNLLPANSSKAKKQSSASLKSSMDAATSLLDGIPETRTVLYLKSRRSLMTSIPSERRGRLRDMRRIGVRLWQADVYYRKIQLDTWPHPGTGRWSSTASNHLFAKTLKRLRRGLLLVKDHSNRYWILGA